MDVFALLQVAKLRDASDLHLVASSPPLLRINGSLEPLSDRTNLGPDNVHEAYLQLTTHEQREYFHHNLELDFARTLRGGIRIRCNAAQQRGAISFAIRLLPPVIPTIDELGLPDVCKDLILRPRGLVMISGPTGSGKSTTLASMIQYLNTM